MRRTGGVLVASGTRVDDLADEERVVADLDRLSHLALDVGRRLVEDRRAGDAVVEREAVQGARGRVHLDRLGELADDGAVLAVTMFSANTRPAVDRARG